VAKLIGLVTGPLFSALRTATILFRAAFVSNPIGLIIALVALLAYVIYENFDQIKEWIGAAWDWISKRTSDAVAAMLGYFEPTIDFFKTLFGAIGDVVTGNFSGAFEKIEAFWQRTVGRIMAGVEKVKGFFRSIGKTLGVVNDDVNGVTQSVADKVTAASGTAAQAAAAGAVAVSGGTTVNVQQDVKMDVRTDDPTTAGNTAANNLKREAQYASRNARGAVAY
jgi:phage-related protein